MKMMFGGALTIALTIAGGATAETRLIPAASSHHYRYEMIEQVPGQPDKGYRMDYDLQVSRAGSVIAIVHDAAEKAGDTWTQTSVDATCAAALHARRGELARITLRPIAPGAAADMSFIDLCAPASVFYPITDVLNVALVQMAPEYGLTNLRAVGDHARTAAYAVHFERLGVNISLTAPGGETRLTAIGPDTATVEWTSDPMDLAIIHRGSLNGQDLTLSGQEHFAFQLDIDARSGELRRASTTSDRLDLLVALPNMAADQRPRVAITRSVSIISTQ